MFSKLFLKKNRNVRKCFGIVGVLYTINRYFEYRIRILCIGLYMGTWVKCIFEHFFEQIQKMSQTCEQFSYQGFLEMFWDFQGISVPRYFRSKKLKIDKLGFSVYFVLIFMFLSVWETKKWEHFSDLLRFGMMVFGSFDV